MHGCSDVFRSCVNEIEKVKMRIRQDKLMFFDYRFCFSFDFPFIMDMICFQQYKNAFDLKEKPWLFVVNVKGFKILFKLGRELQQIYLS